MQVQMAVLADAANVSESGKMNVLGVFDTIMVEEFPIRLPDMVLAIRISLDYLDGGKCHDLSILVRDEDGREQCRIDTTIEMDEIEAGESSTLNEVIALHDVEIEEEGQLSFAILWNGSHQAQIELRIELGEEEG